MPSDTATITLSDFLLARIEEDQVKRGVMREWHTEDCETIPDAAGYTYPCDCGVPERMLAECEAKRRIVEFVLSWFAEEGPDHEIIRHLALPYADHPDYREEWRA